MKKLLLSLVVAFVAMGASAQTLVTNETLSSTFVDGAIITLQTKDTNGGFDYYFNGASSAKTATFQSSNLFKVVAVDPAVAITESANAVEGTTTIKFYLQQVTTEKYVGKNGSAVSAVAAKESAAQFVAYIPKASMMAAWTTKPTDYQTGVNTIRFETSSTYLNCQPKAGTPNYASGTGGYSYWFVNAYTEEEVERALAEQVNVTMDVVYNGNTILTRSIGTAAVGFEYEVPEFDQSLVAAVVGAPEGNVTEAFTLTVTLAEGVKPFKLNSLRAPGMWATTDAASLLIKNNSYDSAEYFFEVPIAGTENFKIYSFNQAKWLGAIDANTAVEYFSDIAAGEFQLIKHTAGAEAIGNVGATASTDMVFLNYRNPGIGSWHVGNDYGSHWFMVYDNTNYQANLTAMGITISNGQITGSTYATKLAEARAKYAAVESVADDVVEGFGELKVALKNAIDATVAARAGQNVDIAALLAALDTANAAVNPNIAVYGKGQNIINNGNAFVALGVASEEGVAAWEAAVAAAEAIDPTTFSEDDVTTITEAYTALVATSANTPGGAYITLASYKVPTDLMCVRYNNGPFVGRYGDDVNTNKTTWKVVAAEGGFKLYNVFSAKYLKMASQTNQNMGLCDEAEASVFIFDLYNSTNAQYGIKYIVSDDYASYPYLHSNNEHTIVRWQADNNSSWYLAASNAETAEAEAAIGSADDLADALTFCVVAESDKGTNPGYYTVSEEYTAEYEAAQGATEGSAEAQRAAAVALRAAFVNGVTLNVPEAGKFYRFQNKTSSKFITSIVNANNDLTLVADGVNPVETIFYYDGTYVVSLADGKVLGNFNQGEPELSWKTVLKDATNSGEITFPVSNVARTFYIQTELDRRLYGACNPSGRGDAVDAAGLATGADYSWVITEVESLPFNATEQEIIAIYSPVALNLQDGVTAYTATVNNDLVPTTEIEGNVIPANTPVLLMFGEDVNADENGLVYFPIATEEAAVVLAEEAAASPLTGSIYAKNAAAETSYFTAQTHETYDENGATVETVDFLALAATEVVPGFASYIEIATASVPESVTAEGGHYDITGEDFVTGIEEVESGANNAQTVIYDLQGRRLSAPVKGINIINGKKVLVK